MAMALLLGPVAACDSPVEPYQPLPSDSPRRHVASFIYEGARLELVTEVSGTRLQAGDSISISVTLRNVSDRDVTLHYASGCSLSYIIQAASGATVSSSFDMLCGFVFSSPVTLPQGEELVETYVWKGTRWKSGYRNGSDWVPGHEESAPPGIYRVWGAFRDVAGCVLIEVLG